MKFTESFRMEKAYFQKLKNDIDIARSYIEAGAVDQARAVLESIVDVDGAVLLLYRNLGELWADLQARIEDLKKALQDLDGKTDKYHDELNEKIDEVNNYLMALIRELQENQHLHICASYNKTGNYIIFYNQMPVIFDAIHEAVGDITNYWSDHQYKPNAVSITVDYVGRYYVARLVGYAYSGGDADHAYMFEFDYLDTGNVWTKVRFWVYSDRVVIK